MLTFMGILFSSLVLTAISAFIIKASEREKPAKLQAEMPEEVVMRPAENTEEHLRMEDIISPETHIPLFIKVIIGDGFVFYEALVAPLDENLVDAMMENFYKETDDIFPNWGEERYPGVYCKGYAAIVLADKRLAPKAAILDIIGRCEEVYAEKVDMELAERQIVEVNGSYLAVMRFRHICPWP